MILKTITALLLLAASARAELTIISAEHRDADSFKRLSEYFTGKESPGRYSIFRTEPDRRDGFYISLIAEKKSDLQSVSSVLLRFIRPASQDSESIEIPVDAIKKKRILVGMTEPDWASPDQLPVAWKVELLDQNQESIDFAESFLWTE